MVITAHSLLLILALVFFLLAALGVSLGRINPLGAGLFCLTLALWWPGGSR